MMGYVAEELAAQSIPWNPVLVMIEQDLQHQFCGGLPGPFVRVGAECPGSAGSGHRRRPPLSCGCSRHSVFFEVAKVCGVEKCNGNPQTAGTVDQLLPLSLVQDLCSVRSSWRCEAKVPIHIRVGLLMRSSIGECGSPLARGYPWLLWWQK